MLESTISNVANHVNNISNNVMNNVVSKTDEIKQYLANNGIVYTSAASLVKNCAEKKIGIDAEFPYTMNETAELFINPKTGKPLSTSSFAVQIKLTGFRFKSAKGNNTASIPVNPAPVNPAPVNPISNGIISISQLPSSDFITVNWSIFSGIPEMNMPVNIADNNGNLNKDSIEFLKKEISNDSGNNVHPFVRCLKVGLNGKFERLADIIGAETAAMKAARKEQEIRQQAAIADSIRTLISKGYVVINPDNTMASNSLLILNNRINQLHVAESNLERVSNMISKVKPDNAKKAKTLAKLDSIKSKLSGYCCRELPQIGLAVSAIREEISNNESRFSFVTANNDSYLKSIQDKLESLKKSIEQATMVNSELFNSELETLIADFMDINECPRDIAIAKLRAKGKLPQ